jgi:ribonucleoside-diphosphate reductase alpha chain
MEEPTAAPPEVDSYRQALQVYEAAKAELEQRLLSLHGQGFYPSPVGAVRFHLPDERASVTTRMILGDGANAVKFYLTPGLYPDGRVGEIFIAAEKAGSFVGGLLDGFAVVVSLALQHGVPLSQIVHKLMFTRFEPAGFSRDPKVGYSTSVVDLIVRWLAYRFEPSSMADYERK